MKTLDIIITGGGAAAWVMLPLLAPAGPAFGSLEHGFLFMPLVAAPLALQLLGGLLATPPRLLRLAQHAQPFAAAMLGASFLAPKGPLAGGLTLGWLAVALLVALGAARQAAKQPGNPNLIAAHVFLPIGAVWLLMSRLGVGPRHFAATTVLLAALHFHFSGFTLQLLIAATGRALTCPRLRALHRVLSICAVAGIPLIAAGNLVSLPPLKFLGVAAIVTATVLLGAVTMALARRTAPAAPRVLLGIAALSIVAGMTLAAGYGAGWVGLPRMAAAHGLLNAVGFTLCGLLAHLALMRRQQLPPARTTTEASLHSQG